ncbi:MAG TPA: CRTAC1 family protein [Vicinamibacterales bacterium]|nr:CRTAC1 family protein [Vicinamibacterales bacterium]
MTRPDSILIPSRRRFLRTLGLTGIASVAGVPFANPRPRAWAAQSPSAPAPLFDEIAANISGIGWVHENAMSDNRYLPETMGPGVAFFDYDNDGWMDIFMVNSGMADFYQPEAPLKNALYKNNRDGTFSDVTDKAGVAGGREFGMGCAIADYDNDGYPDILVTAYGRCTLYHNNGNGTFTDVTEKAGVASPGWTTSAVWFDYDNDGKLDLFLCSFVQYSVKNEVFCGDNKLGKRFYCIPRVFKPTSSLLYRNNGDGTFTKVSGGTDIERALGKALGVVATDINNDGRMDLFVANDTVQNFLFVNRGKGVWDEIGLQAEVGFSSNGTPRSGMGVDAADFNGDGRQDLFVANVDQELFSLYRNEGNEFFADVAAPNAVAQATRLLSGWGLKFFDYDNDGFIDLFLANGHPDDMIENYSRQVRYKEPLVLFHHDGTKLTNVTTQAGPAFQKNYPARGLAVGDFNNDGRIDVLIGNNGDAPVLLKNNAGAGNHWLGVKLQGTGCNRDAIGATITWSANGVTRSRLKTSGGSYLSSHDVREVLGVGAAAKIDWIEIKWPAPSGRVERITAPPIDRYVTVIEGTGRVEG